MYQQPLVAQCCQLNQKQKDQQTIDLYGQLECSEMGLHALPLSYSWEVILRHPVQDMPHTFPYHPTINEPLLHRSSLLPLFTFLNAQEPQHLKIDSRLCGSRKDSSHG